MTKVLSKASFASLKVPVSLLALALAGAVGCSPEPVESNIEHPATAIEHAKKTQDASKTLEEWENSPNHPNQWFDLVVASHDPARIHELCDALSKKADSDLVDYETNLNQHLNDLACAPELVARIRAYWSNKKEEFLFNSFADEPGEPTLPSLESVVDAESGPIFVSADFKPGQIALTFDDGPSATYTPEILEILKNARVRATFFEIGQNAHANPQLSRDIIDAGHSLGSHTFSHPELPKLSYDKAVREIDGGYDNVLQAAGIIMPFFRFPYGSMNSSLKKYVAGRGLANFLWNMDSLDWKLHDPDVLYKNVLTELNREKGGIILFHDIHPQTAIVLPRLLNELSNRRFETYVFVPKS